MKRWVIFSQLFQGANDDGFQKLRIMVACLDLTMENDKKRQ